MIRARAIRRFQMRSAMTRALTLAAVLLAGVVTLPAAAGFRTPESLVRNVYAYYGQGSPGFSGGLPHDPDTARQFFDDGLRQAWSATDTPPYDFMVQAGTWKLGAVSVAVIRRQFDKTYVAVAFANNGHPVSLNFIVVNGPDGWLIADVESPHDSLRMFLAQYRK